MTCNKFLTRYLPMIIMSLLLISVSAKAKNAGQGVKKNLTRNIILINMDDMGYGDAEAYGAINYSTPSIDKLAEQGIRFTNFEDVQPVCTVSRAGLLTGTYPNRMKIGGIHPTSRIGLSSKDETIASMLKQKGYVTGIIGKWHLGDAKKFLPLQHGFDYFFGLPYSNDMWPHNYTPTSTLTIDPSKGHFTVPPLPLFNGNKPVRYIRDMHGQSMLTTWYTQKAVQFIKHHKYQAFFLYLAHSMPHVPIAVSKKFRGKSKQGRYGDVMMEIDWSVGQVMKALKANGLEDNTIVIFTSDNGPWLQFGNHAGSAGGLREGKQTTFEGGNRVPAIMRWPAVIPAGTISNKLVSNIDVLPTIAAITGAPLPTSRVDGVNILPLLKGERNAHPRDHLYYYYHSRYIRSDTNDLEAVRKGHWKLVLPHQYKTNVNGVPGQNGRSGTFHKASIGLSLYNLRRDPGERYNIIKAHPSVVKEMMKLVKQAREDLGDDLTKKQGENRRPHGKCSPCRWPGLPPSWTGSHNAQSTRLASAQIGQKQLKRFAIIYDVLNKTYEKYKSKLKTVGNKAEKQEVRREARKTMMAMIRKRGLTLLQYRQIQVAISKKPHLQQKFRQIKAER